MADFLYVAVALVATLTVLGLAGIAVAVFAKSLGKWTRIGLGLAGTALLIYAVLSFGLPFYMAQQTVIGM